MILAALAMLAPHAGDAAIVEDAAVAQPAIGSRPSTIGASDRAATRRWARRTRASADRRWLGMRRRQATQKAFVLPVSLQTGRNVAANSSSQIEQRLARFE